MKSEKLLLPTSMIPLEDRLIVRPDKAPDMKGSIIVPETYKEKHQPHRGTIVAAGPGKMIDMSSISFKMLVVLSYIAKCAHKVTLGVISMPEFDLHHEPMPLKSGDRVMYGHFAGTPVEDPKTTEKLLIMRLTDVFIKLQPGEESILPDNTERGDDDGIRQLSQE